MKLIFNVKKVIGASFQMTRDMYVQRESAFNVY